MDGVRKDGRKEEEGRMKGKWDSIERRDKEKYEKRARKSDINEDGRRESGRQRDRELHEEGGQEGLRGEGAKNK